MIGLEIKIQGDLSGLNIEFDNLAERIANQIPIEARAVMDESTPTGRLYRRGGIRGRMLKGLRRAPGTKNRAIVGTRIHRASAPGQAPAKDSGRLYKDIKVSRSKRGTFRVRFGAEYAGFLEFKLNRPFALPAIERAVNKVLNQ